MIIEVTDEEEGEERRREISPGRRGELSEKWRREGGREGYCIHTDDRKYTNTLVVTDRQTDGQTSHTGFIETLKGVR